MVPSTGCRIESPSPKKDVLRYGFIFGWSCMSCRHAPPIRQTLNSTSPIPNLSLNLDITDFDRPKTLQQVRHLSVVKLRIVCLHREEEPIASGERKTRYVENRMIWLRQLVQHEHSQHRRKRRKQHRHFKSDRNESRPTVVRLAAHVDRIVDHFDPVLHEEPGEPADYAADKHDQRQTRVRESDRFREFLDRERRVAINPPVSFVVNFARRMDQIVRAFILRNYTVKRRRM